MNIRQGNLLVLVVFFILISVSLYRSYKAEVRNDEMVKDFTERKMNGLITRSKAGSKGSHLLNIKDRESNLELKYIVLQNWFFLENNVQVGDSVSKLANTKILSIFKFKENGYEKCCDYEVIN